jgi:hypothetical protein
VRRRVRGSDQNVEIGAESGVRSTFWSLYDQNVEAEHETHAMSTFWSSRAALDPPAQCGS